MLCNPKIIFNFAAIKIMHRLSKREMTEEFPIDNQIVYLVCDSNGKLFKDISVNEWNAMIESYEKDKNAHVEEYDPEQDGVVFITTNLYNILKNHSLMDMRFIYRHRTKYHKTDFVNYKY